MKPRSALTGTTATFTTADEQVGGDGDVERDARGPAERTDHRATLKPAWKRGMIVRPRRCSTAAPRRSWPRPRCRCRSRSGTARSPPAVRRPGCRAQAPPGPPRARWPGQRRCGPARSGSPPDRPTASAMTAPAAMASRISPSSDGVACTASRICGMRDVLAKPRPLPTKATKTAYCARRADRVRAPERHRHAAEVQRGRAPCSSTDMAVRRYPVSQTGPVAEPRHPYAAAM